MISPVHPAIITLCRFLMTSTAPRLSDKVKDGFCDPYAVTGNVGWVAEHKALVMDPPPAFRPIISKVFNRMTCVKGLVVHDNPYEEPILEDLRNQRFHVVAVTQIENHGKDEVYHYENVPRSHFASPWMKPRPFVKAVAERIQDSSVSIPRHPVSYCPPNIAW